MTLPTLDLSLYMHGNASERQKLASRLLDSLSEHGFVKLVGHGVSDERIDELFQWVSRSRRCQRSPLCELGHKDSKIVVVLINLQNKSFFAMPDEDKLAIAHPGGSAPQRGFSSIGAESSAGLYRKGILKTPLTENLQDSRVSHGLSNVDSQ